MIETYRKEIENINFRLRDYSVLVMKYKLYESNYSNENLPDEVLQELKDTEQSILYQLNALAITASYSPKKMLEMYYKKYCIYPVSLAVVFYRAWWFSGGDNSVLPCCYYFLFDTNKDGSRFYRESEFYTGSNIPFVLQKNENHYVYKFNFWSDLSQWIYVETGLNWWALVLILLFFLGVFRGNLD